MTISMLSNLIKPKGARGFSHLAIPIHFALAQQEQSPTMLPLESIGCNFSQTWTFRVNITTIPSSQGDIFFISVRDSMGIGTQEETR